MSDLAAIITAAGGLLVSVGAGARFIWNKVETRFALIEAELVKCRERESESKERRAVQLIVIEMLWQEVTRISPASKVLIRCKKLLDDLKVAAEQRDE